MLKIHKESDQSATLKLSGRIRSTDIAGIQAEMCGSKVLDLTEVTLVDVAVVRFLSTCEREGIDLIQCPPYIREWILRERVEGGPAWANRPQAI